MENRRYGGIATLEHFTYYKLHTIVGYYSFLFGRNHHTKKYGRYLHSEIFFLNISVTEAYILKNDSFVIALFAMFSNNSE